MKKRLTIVVAVLCFLSLVTATSLVRAADVKPIDLKVMHPYSAEFLVHKDVLVPWAKMLEERTGGRVKATIYPGELLGKGKDSYDLTIAGTADVAWSFIEATPGRFPLMSVYQLPFLEPDTKIGSRVMWEHYLKDPRLQAEFRDVKVLWLYSMIPVQLHMVKKPVRKLEDLKGMKIRTVGGIPAETFKALGATPVVISPADMYEALERGTVDGTMYTWAGIIPQGVYTLTKYHTEANLFGGAFYVVMNKKKFESLPPDVQKIIDSISGSAAGDMTADAFVRTDQEAIAKIKTMGHEIIQLPPAEMNRWKNACKPVWDGWLKDMEAKKLPGRAMLDEAMALTDRMTKAK